MRLVRLGERCLGGVHLSVAGGGRTQQRSHHPGHDQVQGGTSRNWENIGLISDGHEPNFSGILYLHTLTDQQKNELNTNC